jgi:hypothetical protein
MEIINVIKICQTLNSLIAFIDQRYNRHTLASSSAERLDSSNCEAREDFSLVSWPTRLSASSNWRPRSDASFCNLDLVELRSTTFLLASSILALASESWLSICLDTFSADCYIFWRKFIAFFKMVKVYVNRNIVLNFYILPSL